LKLDRNKIKSIVLKNPSIEFIIRRILSGNVFNRAKKRIWGVGNKITYDKSTILSNVVFKIKGDNNSVVIGKRCILNNVTFNLEGVNHKIKIGDNVRFSRGSDLWVQDSNGKLTIGNFSTFENVHIAVSEPNSSVNIGSDCMFAYDIDLRTGDSHSIIDADTNKRVNIAKNIVIGDHVWIASHCVILKGCTIPNDCVVAVGSILTKTITDKVVIVGGNPAKVIKKSIIWNREKLFN